MPAQFLEHMSRLLGEEYPDFFASLSGSPVRGLRVNTLKLAPTDFQNISPFPLGNKVNWCASAFNLPTDQTDKAERSALAEPGKHPYHPAGLYYLQDPSAMAVAELLAPRPGERILDLAAAPGGKTTHIASLMRGSGFLLANEIKTKRINHLLVNLERWGAGNISVTNETPERLADHFGAWFDRVLVDAPCSGEGMFRRDPGARADWSEEMVAGCAIRQKNILHVAAHLVRPGGHLLYSTCTFAPEENEAVIGAFIQTNTDFEVEELAQLPGFMPGRPDWLPESSPELLPLSGAVRLFPHRLEGEGHFACLLHRVRFSEPDRSLPGEFRRMQAPGKKYWQEFRKENLVLEFLEERLHLQGERLYYIPSPMPDMKGLRLSMPGIWLGTCKKERFEPAHPLALHLLPGQSLNQVPFSATDIELTRYLRGEILTSPGPDGWVVISVDSWPLGWGKRVQGRVKNHYPHGWKLQY